MDQDFKQEFTSLVYYTQNILSAFQSEILDLNEVDENQGPLSNPKKTCIEPEDVLPFQKKNQDSIINGIGGFLDLSKEDIDILAASATQSNPENSFYAVSTFADRLQPFTIRALVTMTNYMQFVFNCNIQHMLTDIIDEQDEDKQILRGQQLHASIRQECLYIFKTHYTYLKDYLEAYKKDISSIKSLQQAERYILNRIANALNRLYGKDGVFKLSDKFIGNNTILQSQQFAQQTQQLKGRIETLEILYQNLTAFVARSAELSAIIKVESTVGDVKTAQQQLDRLHNDSSNFQSYFCSLFADDNILYNNFFVQMLRKEKIVKIPENVFIINEYQAIFGEQNPEKPITLDAIFDNTQCFIAISKVETNEIVEVLPCIVKDGYYYVPLKILIEYVNKADKQFTLKKEFCAQTYRQKDMFYDKDFFDDTSKQHLLYQIAKHFFGNMLTEITKCLGTINCFNQSRLEYLMTHVDYFQIRIMGDSYAVVVSPNFYYPFALSAKKDIHSLMFCSGSITEIFKEYLPKHLVDEQVFITLHKSKIPTETVDKVLQTYYNPSNQQTKFSGINKFIEQVYKFYSKNNDAMLTQLTKGDLKHQYCSYKYNNVYSYLSYAVVGMFTDLCKQ